jgi:hypothetical protein
VVACIYSTLTAPEQVVAESEAELKLARRRLRLLGSAAERRVQVRGSPMTGAGCK